MEHAATVRFAEVLEGEKIDFGELEALRKAAFGSEAGWRELRAVGEELSAFGPATAPGRQAKRAFVFLTLGLKLAARRELEDLKPPQDSQTALLLGRCLLELGEPKRALEILEAGLTKAKGEFALLSAKAEALTALGSPSQALDVLEPHAQKFADRAELHYQMGAALEALGEYDQAMDRYEEALERDPDHARALFRLAYNHELRGSQDLAIEYYRRCGELVPGYANALVNLALLLEDRGNYQEAAEIYHRILRVRPTHARAKMFLKDCEASLDMYYDEDQARRSDRRNAILRIPVTDFELSVRARNCLNKMNIRNLGDLVTRTEEELLSYKNFGETSLQEIKQMLAQKGLRLGMFREEADERQAPSVEKRAEDEELLKKPIGDLELSVRCRNCMERLNLRTIGELVQKSEQDLLAVKNFGQTSLDEIKQKLADLGLSLRRDASPATEGVAGRPPPEGRLPEAYL